MVSSSKKPLILLILLYDTTRFVGAYDMGNMTKYNLRVCAMWAEVLGALYKGPAKH